MKYSYKNKVEVIAGFYKGFKGLIIEERYNTKGDVDTYAVKLVDGTIAFVHEDILKPIEVEQ